MDEAERRQEFERYFADPQAPKDRTLRPGAHGAWVVNLGLALSRLDYDRGFHDDLFNDVFDEKLSAELKRLQQDLKHSSDDGQCGPRTRKLLVNALFELEGMGVDFSPFDRMTDPERRAEGEAFMSYAREDAAAVEAHATLLRAWGYSPWYDVEMPIGEKYANTLLARIKRSYALIAFESPHAIDSRWVKKEIEYADANDVPILTIELTAVGKAHPLAKILYAHNRFKHPAPSNIFAPEAKTYRGKLHEAIAAAHKNRS